MPAAAAHPSRRPSATAPGAAARERPGEGRLQLGPAAGEELDEIERARERGVPADLRRQLPHLAAVIRGPAEHRHAVTLLDAQLRQRSARVTGHEPPV